MPGKFKAQPEEQPEKKPTGKGVKSLRQLLPADPKNGENGVPLPVLVKNTTGRPTKYDPSWMLDKVIEVGSNGGTHAEMCIELGIVVDTFHNWLRLHKPFSEAVKRADTAAQVWWERAAKNGATGQIQGWNPTTYIFHMKNRFRESYRDKPEIEVNGPVNVVAVTVDSRALDTDQRQALRQALLAAKQATGGPVIDADYEENE